MKVCAQCGMQLNDDAAFCPNCGTACAAGEAQQAQTPPPAGDAQQAYQQTYYQAPYMPYDHTAEFDPQDISSSKVLCMAMYLLGIPGMIIALLAGAGSPYVAFHVRQSLKISVVGILAAIIGAVLCWTIIALPLAGIVSIVLLVVRIICFAGICQGKAVEAPIVRDLGFLK